MIASLLSLATAAPSPLMDMLAQGLIPSACAGGPCQLCDLYQLAHNIIELLLQIAVPLAIAMLFYGGFLYISAGADGGNVAKGKKTIMSAAIGLIIAFGAYAIITSALLIIGFKMPASEVTNLKNWYDFPKCDRYGSLTLIQKCGDDGGLKSGYCAAGSVCQPIDGLYSCVASVPIDDFIPTQPSTVCTKQCENPGDVCIGAVSGTQGSLETCVPRDNATLQNALSQIGITVNKNCGPGGVSGTCIDKLSQEAIDDLIRLKNACGCNLVITGGNETGGNHSQSHLDGNKVDLRSRDIVTGEDTDITTFIEENYEKLDSSYCTTVNGTAPTCYRDSAGHIYSRELEGQGNEHWDVCYSNCTH